jgi:riboflavin biosynthesis pyrimidine reductase
MGQTSTVFTRLDAGGPVDDDRLAELYRYPAPGDRVWVRANVIAGIDGAATTGGLSGGLGSAGDRSLFAVLREAADAILVGAGTARAEGYRGARMAADQRDRRRARGQAEIPPIALVSRSGAIASDLPVLTDTEVPPLVLTTAEAAGPCRRRLGAAAEVLDCSAGDPARVDLATALSRLSGRGWNRVLAEGGPTLLAGLVDDDLLDEMCLTMAPVMVAGTAPRVIAGPAEVLHRMRPEHVLTDSDGFLYLRYVRARPGRLRRAGRPGAQ